MRPLAALLVSVLGVTQIGPAVARFQQRAERSALRRPKPSNSNEVTFRIEQGGQPSIG
jgi:hypothetical protein